MSINGAVVVNTNVLASGKALEEYVLSVMMMSVSHVEFSLRNGW